HCPALPLHTLSPSPYTTLFRSTFPQSGVTRPARSACRARRHHPAPPAPPGTRHFHAPPPPARPNRIRSARCVRDGPFHRPSPPRSEEHTSELQSRENLVCRLLL